jgi:hypothetical protein
MGIEIILPPGYSLRIDYDPDRAPVSLTVSVFRDGQWVGAANVNPLAARQGQLQEVVDVLTKRSARPMLDGRVPSDVPR